MTRLADGLSALWILFVGAAYFGPLLAPRLWVFSPALLMVYGIALIAAVVVLCLRWLGRSTRIAPEPPALRRR